MDRIKKQCLPSHESLLCLERIARSQGSGIKFNSLEGVWDFVSVWREGKDSDDFATSRILRFLSAKLHLAASKDKSQFSIMNSVQLFGFTIKFSGFGELTGKQPILFFSFDRIIVKLGRITFINRSLEPLIDNKRPFFSLVALEESCGWLAARGKGGGLAVWIKDS